MRCQALCRGCREEEDMVPAAEAVNAHSWSAQPRDHLLTVQAEGFQPLCASGCSLAVACLAHAQESPSAHKGRKSVDKYLSFLALLWDSVRYTLYRLSKAPQ